MKKRTTEEIRAYLDETFDKVWLIRNCYISNRTQYMKSEDLVRSCDYE